MSTSAARQDVLTHLRAEIRRLERRPALRAGVLPSGVPSVDALLPGGFPCGALSELRGGPACGKTAVALSLMAPRILNHAVWKTRLHAPCRKPRSSRRDRHSS